MRDGDLAGIVVAVAGRIVAAIALEIRDGFVVHIHGIGKWTELPPRAARLARLIDPGHFAHLLNLLP
ncbi:MAG TPA: hypothetical protein VM282_22495 [Acidimicrobiales bacterium]|nr:hypothetical protein [Acidimicrobiales bacterium]